jgi:hypothetical protein
MGERRDTGVWWGNLRGRDHLKDLGIDGKIMLKMDLQNRNGRALTGLICVRIGTGGGFL